jgi:peptidoglycan/LPS O-acetylase OafA/YrhL
MTGTAAPAKAVDQSGLWGLRALAALLIVAAHAVAVTGLLDDGLVGQVAAVAITCVHVFLVQSAYLLGRGFLRRQRAAERPEPARRFLWKRATRILPGYWLLLFASVFVLLPPGHLAQWNSPIDAVAALFLVNVYSVPALLAAPAHVWCLQVEAGFYLLLPIHDRLSRRFVGAGRFPEQLALRFLALYAVIGFLFLAALYTGGYAVGFTWPFAYLTTFALGLGLAVVDVCRPAGVPGNRRPQLSAAWCVGLALGALALVGSAQLEVEAVNITEPIPLWQSVLRRGTNDLAAFLLVAAFVFPDGRRSAIRTALGSAPAQWLGERSFHVYLWHIPVLLVLDRLLADDGAHPPYLVLVALAVPISVAVAALAHALLAPLAKGLRSATGDPTPAFAR